MCVAGVVLSGGKALEECCTRAVLEQGLRNTVHSHTEVWIQGMRLL